MTTEKTIALTTDICVCILIHYLGLSWASLVAQTVENLPAVWETWVQSLGQEGLLEKEVATHSSILAWKIPWMEDPTVMGSQRVGHD